VHDVQRRIDEAVAAGGYQLDLYGCRLTEVPEAVRGLTPLRSLRLASNRLTALPDWLGELTNLTSLDVSGNKLTGLPDSIARLRTLYWLNLNGNKLGTVPDVLFSLTSLDRLNLSAIKLTAVPEALAGLTALARLDLGCNKITQLSPVIGELTELRSLYLNDNRLASLPDSIGNLVNLVELRLQDNLLTELPGSMSRLRSLAMITVVRNRIAVPPTMLAELPELTGLYLADNPLPDADEYSREPVDRLLPADARTVKYSPTFKRFLQELDEPTYEGSGREQVEVHPYLETVHRLRGNERTKAEDVLIANLSTGNPRAAKALVEITSVRAIPALIHAAATHATPAMRLAAAEALLQLRDTSGRQALVEILRAQDGNPEVRRGAVALLTRFPHPDTDFLLEVACTDPDSSVRSSAFDAVLTAHGLAGESTSRGEVLFSIAGRLLSSLQTIRHEAHTEMRTILARRKAGATTKDLNLTWRIPERDEAFDKLIDSFEDDTPHWPIDGLRDRTGPERALVENLVLLRLDQDHRAVRAAGALHVRRAVEPLRELLRTKTGPTREEIESIVETLSEPA
jgi:hypothetical protein